MRGKRMKEKFIRFMQGRYGVDQFSKFLMGVAVVAILISSFARVRFLYPLAWIVILYVYFRMFSKNYQKRYEENQKYLELTKGIRGIFQKKQNMMKQRKNYHIYKCPNCKQKIRIPKGKGKIEISCPTCRTKFTKRS